MEQQRKETERPRQGMGPDDLIDFNELSLGAAEALYSALKDGQKKYWPGYWKTVALQSHLEHALNHTAEAMIEGLDRRELREHLTHLVCRALMAWRLFELDGDD